MITFYFFVPYVQKIISRHLSLFKYMGRGGPWGYQVATQRPVNESIVYHESDHIINLNPLQYIL